VKAIQARKLQAIKARELIDNAQLTAEQRSLFQQKVQHKFHEWLRSSWSHQHLMNLAGLKTDLTHVQQNTAQFLSSSSAATMHTSALTSSLAAVHHAQQPTNNSHSAIVSTKD